MREIHPQNLGEQTSNPEFRHSAMTKTPINKQPSRVDNTSKERNAMRGEGVNLRSLRLWLFFSVIAAAPMLLVQLLMQLLLLLLKLLRGLLQQPLGEHGESELPRRPAAPCESPGERGPKRPGLSVCSIRSRRKHVIAQGARARMITIDDHLMGES